MNAPEHKNNQLLSSIVESITDAFYSLDKSWCFTYLNREAEKQLVQTRDSLIGKNIWQTFPELQGGIWETELRKAAELNQTVSFETFHPRLDKWFSVRAYPSADGLSVYFIDITEQRRAAEAIRLNEERFRLLSKATNDAIWDWDWRTNTLWWNEGFEALFGFRRHEIERGIESWSTRVHPDDVDRVTAGLHQVEIEGQQSWSGEYRFRRKNGLYAWVLDRGYFIRDSSGKTIRMIGGMTDVTERKKAEERIAAQAALLDIAPEAIMLQQLDSSIIFWNKGAEKIFGWNAEEVYGKKSAELLHVDREKFQQAFAELLQQGNWAGEFVQRTKDAREIQVHSKWTFVRDAEGKPKSMLCITTDITEKKKLEANFLRAQRLESIGTLAGGIAHDLNNVLAPIIMALEMLNDEVASEEGRTLLSTLQKAALRGADLVKQVLSFARGMEGRTVTVHAIHLAREIQKIVRDTFPKNINFKLEVSSSLWPITGDPTQLHQVLMNLCVNARDAMPAGGQLELRLENVVLDEVYAGFTSEAKPGQYVVLCVTDTGMGIPHEIREKIFEPFFTTKEVGRGTGLGLSTTMAIVKSHNGFLHLYSEVGKGSTFKIYIPAGAKEEVQTPDVEAAQLPRGNGELLLIVDDESAVRAVAEKTLERFGYRVMLAANGAEALATYAQHRDEIALVLTDMAMPIMDGPATIVALKAMNPQVPIIGCSGVSANAEVAKALGVGVRFFVPKPYTAETLLRTISQALKERHSVSA